MKTTEEKARDFIVISFDITLMVLVGIFIHIEWYFLAGPAFMFWLSLMFYCLKSKD